MGTAAGTGASASSGSEAVHSAAAIATVGGILPNIIKFNTGYGIYLSRGAGNALTSNSIYANTVAGIHLANNANYNQVAPVLKKPAVAGVNTTITGTLKAAANLSYYIEIFENPSGDQGKTLLGSIDITTNSMGMGVFSQNFTGLAAGVTITATATDSLENTSAFSVAVTVP